VVSRITANVQQLGEVADFLAPKLLKIPELWLSSFASKKAPNPPFCQTAC